MNKDTRVIIDGATGFLAVGIAYYFQRLGHKIVLISRSNKLSFKRKELFQFPNISLYSSYDNIESIADVDSIFIHTASATPNNCSNGHNEIFFQNR